MFSRPGATSGLATRSAVTLPKHSPRSESATTGHARLTLLLCVCGLFLWGRGAASAGAAKVAGSSVMQRVAEAYRELEQALDGAEPESVDAAVEALDSAVGIAGVLRASAYGARSEDFARDLRRIRTVGQEIAELARTDRNAGALQAFAELRNTCVACHVKVRDDNEALGLFPAVGKTIFGKISIRDADGRPVEDASGTVVYLDGSVPYVHERLNPTIRQQGQSFEPAVLPVVKGTTIDFHNDDEILHNVFSLSKTAAFDLDVYGQGETRSVLLDQPGLVRVYCNLHPNMAASILVLGNPHFATTDIDGRFVITGLPNGFYTIRSWSELGAEGAHSVRVNRERLVEVEFEVEERLRPAPLRDKLGRAYPTRHGR